MLVEGSLEVKLPTIWRDEKAVSREKSQKRKDQKKEDAGARKGRKVTKHCVFWWFCGSGGLESRLAKAAGAETSGEMRDEKLHAVVARSTFPSQNVQNTPAPDHFWKLRCRKSARRCGAKHISKSKCTKHTILGPLLEVEIEKVHAFVARSTFRSQNVQNTPFSDHFWKLRCRKSARRCGAKHISKSKCTKHTIHGPLLEVEISKKCTPLWREAHFEVKMYKTPHVRATFGGSDVEKVHALVARSTFRSQNVKNTRGSDHFWRFRCRFASLHCTTLHYTTLHSTTLLSTTLHYTTQHYNYNYTTTLHYTPLHWITRHYTTLHCTTLHYTTLHYTALPTIHSTTLHYTKLHYTTLHSTTLHYTTLHYITLHYLPLHFTSLHYTPLHYNYNYDYTTTLHYTKLHYTTLHYTTLHYIPLHSTTPHYITLHYNTLNDTAPQIDRQTDR